MQNAGLDEAQAGIKIAGRKINNLRYADWNSAWNSLGKNTEVGCHDKFRDTVLKSRGITLQTKVLIAKAMVFLVVMYEGESWTIKNPEHQRIDAFELWCWKRLLRIPWTARRSNQSILKKINLWYSLEGLILKHQYFGHLICRAVSLERSWCWERLRAEGEGETEDEMVGWYHLLNRHEFEQTSGDGEGQGILVCCSSWGCKESDKISDWTITTTGTSYEWNPAIFVLLWLAYFTGNKVFEVYPCCHILS